MTATPASLICLILCLSANALAAKKLTTQPYPGRVSVEVLGKTPKISIILGENLNLQAIAFSPDYTRCAVPVEADDWHLEINGQIASKKYHEIAPGSVVFSPDGQRLAFVARREDHWRMVVDGKEGAPADLVGVPVFSADSRHVAWVVRTEATWRVFQDFGETAKGEDMYERPRFSPAGGQAYSVVRAGNRETLYYGTDGLTNFPSIRDFDVQADRLLLVTSETPRPPSRKLRGYRHWSSGYHPPSLPGEVMVRAGRFVGGPYDRVAGAILAPRGTNFAYCAYRDKKEFVVVNGVEQKHYPGISGQKGIMELPVFSPDGQRLAYAASEGKGKQFLVIDGLEGERFDSIGDGSLVFSPDSKRFAYLAQRGRKAFWVLDGIPGPEIATILLMNSELSGTFSPDSQHFVTALPFTVDGQAFESPHFGLRRPIFIHATRFRFPGWNFAEKRGEILKIEADLP